MFPLHDVRYLKRDRAKRDAKLWSDPHGIAKDEQAKSVSRCRKASGPGPADHSKNGGARRDRTDDLKLAKLALSQLSYGPIDAVYIGSRPGKSTLRFRAAGGLTHKKVTHRAVER